MENAAEGSGKEKIGGHFRPQPGISPMGETKPLACSQTKRHFGTAGKTQYPGTNILQINEKEVYQMKNETFRDDIE